MPQAKSRFSSLLPYLLYAAIQLCMIILMPKPQDVGDCWRVRLYAGQVVQGDFSSFKPLQYLSQYPNNIGIVLTYAFIYLFFPGNIYVLKLLNLLFNLGTMFFIVRLYKLNISEEKQKYRLAFKYYLLFFLPALFLVHFTYGDVPSTFFTVAAMYYALQYADAKRFKYCITACILLLAAFFLRQCALLIAASVILYWVYVFYIRDKQARLKTSAAILATALLLAFQCSIVDVVFRQFHCWEAPVTKYCQPPARWIYMGMPTDKRYGYWDGGGVTRQYALVNGDKEALNRILMDRIAYNLKKTPPENLIFGYIKKNYWLWSEGTFESMKYGLGFTPNGEWIYGGGVSAQYGRTLLWFTDFTYSCIKAHYIFILFFAGLYFFLQQRNKAHEKVLYALLILLFFGFYTFWEMKSRYLYPIYPVLLIASFISVTRIFEWYKRKKNSILNRKDSIKKC